MPDKRQQQQPRIEVELTLSGPLEKDGKNYISGIVKARRGNDILVNEDVRFYLDGKADSVVETTDEAGQCAKEFEIAGFGNHTLQAFFPRLLKWTHPRGFVSKKPEMKKAKEENPSLDVWPVRMDGYYRVNATVNIQEMEVTKVDGKELCKEVMHPTHKVYDVRFFLPGGKLRTVKTANGIAVLKVPFPQAETRIMVSAGGQSETVILEPANFTHPHNKENK